VIQEIPPSGGYSLLDAFPLRYTARHVATQSPAPGRRLADVLDCSTR
jgi:hypothetical protein